MRKFEYVWLDGYKPEQSLRSKVKVDEYADFWSFDGSSTQQATGDKSDCIEGIFQTRYKIKKKDLLDDEILNNYLNNNLKAKQKYELNKKIIDFNYIPKNLYNKIIKKYLDIFKT